MATFLNGATVLAAPFVLLIVGMASDVCAPISLCGRAPFVAPLVTVLAVVIAVRSMIRLHADGPAATGRHTGLLAVAGPALLAIAYLLAMTGIEANTV